ncbi:pyridoxamine 5'-phosphate oxidase [Palleronia aestuarii]|uniref:Pyridoxamine 5'-phosphate oxidase n=2 Tax=Palleronia aestuarii TaxID=568105 RepID=A0A2W7N835_9RHOB|nr:pyridoxamine 5'-phosphate oxidase [Palleronia aestuarii]
MDAVDDAAHPWRSPVLATTGLDGGAEARLVVLREACRDRAVIGAQTDLASPKVAELRAEPRATFLFWDPQTQVQLRARVDMKVIAGTELNAVWAAMPEVARLNYGNRPAPGTPIETPEDHDRTADRERFAVLTGHVVSLDVVDLSLDPHLRAVFDRGDGFQGKWLAP